jgi:hypothetical protein
LCLFEGEETGKKRGCRPRTYPWAELMHRENPLVMNRQLQPSVEPSAAGESRGALFQEGRHALALVVTGACQRM